jgi:hypothetical protein
MKLLKELPELEVKIETGDLTLTNIAQAQTFFNSQSKDSNQKCEIEDKKEILKNLENKSTREAERTLLQLSPESLPKERLRQLTEDKMELRLILDQETKEALDKIKALLSHRHKNLSMGELVKIIAKETLRKLDPAQRTRKKKPAVSRTPAPETAEPNTRNPPPAPETAELNTRNSPPAQETAELNTRNPPVTLRNC